MPLPGLLLYLGPATVAASGGLVFLSPVMAMACAPEVSFPIGLVGSRMRAIGYARYTVFLHIGYGLGPLYIGSVSAWLDSSHGEESLRYAMLSRLAGIFHEYRFH